MAVNFCLQEWLKVQLTNVAAWRNSLIFYIFFLFKSETVDVWLYFYSLMIFLDLFSSLWQTVQQLVDITAFTSDRFWWVMLSVGKPDFWEFVVSGICFEILDDEEEEAGCVIWSKTRNKCRLFLHHVGFSKWTNSLLLTELFPYYFMLAAVLVRFQQVQ